MIETDRKKLIRRAKIRRNTSREPTDNMKIIRGYYETCNNTSICKIFRFNEKTLLKNRIFQN